MAGIGVGETSILRIPALQVIADKFIAGKIDRQMAMSSMGIRTSIGFTKLINARKRARGIDVVAVSRPKNPHILALESRVTKMETELKEIKEVLQTVLNAARGATQIVNTSRPNGETPRARFADK